MMMNCRGLEMTVVSADNLPDIRRLSEMKVYAKVSINEEKGTQKKSTVDKAGSVSPRWNFAFDYTLNEEAVEAEGVQVVVQLYCARTLLPDKYIGELRIPVKTLFESAAQNLGDFNARTYRVAGTTDGTLDILYRFGDIFTMPAAAPAPEAKETSFVGQALQRFGLGVLVQGCWVVLDEAVNN